MRVDLPGHQVRAEVKALAATLEQKGVPDVTAKLDALVVDMQQKASLAKVDEIIAKMDQDNDSKDSSTEAPSADQLDVMLSESEQKCREIVAATLEKLEERQAITEKTVRSHAAKLAELKKIDTELECKANVRDVPTLDQFKRLSATVERKANASKVPTLTQFGEIEKLVESKASASGVPTLAEFHELRASVEKKADIRSVPCDVDLKRVLAELDVKANSEDLQELHEEIKKKANSGEVP